MTANHVAVFSGNGGEETLSHRRLKTIARDTARYLANHKGVRSHIDSGDIGLVKIAVSELGYERLFRDHGVCMKSFTNLVDRRLSLYI
jgi:hypothetical protein